jgi:hypothetical protein
LKCVEGLERRAASILTLKDGSTLMIDQIEEVFKACDMHGEKEMHTGIW